MKKVVVFLADGFEEVEGLTVVDLLRRAGAVVETVSVMGKLQIDGAHGIQVEADELFEKAFFDDAELLVLPGGMPGTLHLKEHKGLADLLCEFNENGRKIAAICAAPSVLGENGILEGKHAVSYPGFEEKLLGARVGAEKVAVDGNIVTSRGMGTAIEFAMAIVKWLDPQADIDAMEANIMYFK